VAEEGLVAGCEVGGPTTLHAGPAAGAAPVVAPIGRLVVVCPSTFEQLDAVKADIEKAFRGSHPDEVVWYETNPEAPGEGPARRGLVDGATVVCSLGGDGTARSVSTVLVDSGVALGLLPGGAGNLFARSLEIPVDDLSAALDVVLTGAARRVDVGACCHLGRRPGAGVSGYGRHGFGRPDDGRGRRTHQERARLDDRELDVVVLAPGGIVGWAAVLHRMGTARRGDHRDLRRFASDFVDVTADRAILCERDGDAVGSRRNAGPHASRGLDADGATSRGTVMEP